VLTRDAIGELGDARLSLSVMGMVSTRIAIAQPAAMARTGLAGAMARSMAAWLTRCPPGPKMACLREGSK
jgi:hypothetical protein